MLALLTAAYGSTGTAVNPVVTQYNLAPADRLLLPAGYVAQAMEAGSVQLLFAAGNNTTTTAVWTFQQGDTWPMDGNTTITAIQPSGLISFQAAQCMITAGGAAGVQKAQNLAVYAAGICR